MSGRSCFGLTGSRGGLLSSFQPVAVVCLLLFGVSCSTGDGNWTQLKERIREEFPTVVQLSTDELARWLESGDREVVLLDARSPEEYAVSHLEGAVHAETEDQAKRILGQSPAGSRVVVYCSVGYRSSALAARLQKSGFEVYNLEGSIFAWANEGRPLFQGDRRVETVHPYDATWGRYLDRRLWEEHPVQ